MNLAQLIDAEHLYANRWSWLSVLAQLAGEPCSLPPEILNGAKDHPPVRHHLLRQDRDEEEEVAESAAPDAREAECLSPLPSPLAFQEHWRVQYAVSVEVSETP